MVFEHPEYGSAVTDDNGRFAIPAEGGQDMIIFYTRQGFIPVQRKAYVPWNDFAVFDTIQMIEMDTASTIMAFDGCADTVLAHRSTAVTDELGTWAVTIVTTGDNQAFITDKDGNDVTELDSIEVRTTEYPTPESTPAALSPTSAFTFCAEFTADGVKRIKFANPVTVFVNNFLGFDVGLIVPVGYYDTDLGYWIPKENAKVVRLLDTDGDGVVDALDANDDNIADDLNENGSVFDEVTGLGDTDYYQPGDTMWRFQVDHFSPWDCNNPAYFPPGQYPRILAAVLMWIIKKPRKRSAKSNQLICGRKRPGFPRIRPHSRNRFDPALFFRKSVNPQNRNKYSVVRGFCSGKP